MVAWNHWRPVSKCCGVRFDLFFESGSAPRFNSSRDNWSWLYRAEKCSAWFPVA